MPSGGGCLNLRSQTPCVGGYEAGTRGFCRPLFFRQGKRISNRQDHNCITIHLPFAYWLVPEGSAWGGGGSRLAAILHNVTIRLFLSYSATLCNLAWGCFFWRVFL